MPDGPSSTSDNAPASTALWVAWTETALIAVGMVLIGLWLEPEDPFFIKASFCWSAFAPLLAGVRYGFAYGFGCALLQITAIAACWRWHLLPIQQFPAEFSLGLLAVGMLVGEFSDMWQRRVRRLSVFNEYRRTRLEEFARGYYLLKISHDSLEQKVAGTTHNMREALMTLRNELLSAKQQENQPLLGFGGRILGIFENYGYVQLAAVYAVDKGQLLPPPAAPLGKFGQVDSQKDHLMQKALVMGKLMSVERAGIAGETNTPLLAAIPMIDAQGRVWAVIAVRQMLFIAFQEENLKLLSVLGGHIADIFSFGTRMFSGEPLGKDEFRQQLHRSVTDLKTYVLPACVVGLHFEDATTPEHVSQQILRQRRGLDQAIIFTTRQGTSAILVLLNLSDEVGMEGYISRLERFVKERFGSTCEELQIKVTRHPLDRYHSADDFFELLMTQYEAA